MIHNRCSLRRPRDHVANVMFRVGDPSTTIDELRKEVRDDPSCAPLTRPVQPLEPNNEPIPLRNADERAAYRQEHPLDELMPRSPSEEATRGLWSVCVPPRRAVIRWPTGSGKTLAFSLPMIARLDMPACGTGLQALVVTPTRELALQTLQVLKKLTDHGKTNKKGYTVKVMALLGRSTPRVESELQIPTRYCNWHSIRNQQAAPGKEAQAVTPGGRRKQAYNSP